MLWDSVFGQLLFCGKLVKYNDFPHEYPTGFSNLKNIFLFALVLLV